MQHNDPIVLSKKVVLLWRICGEMAEDTMDADPIKQGELIKWEEIPPAMLGQGNMSTSSELRQ